MLWTWEMTRDFDGSPTRADIGPAESAELKMGVIPGHRRLYDDGVEVWPGNHGVIPDDWDGMYPEKPRYVYRTRSGRSRRRKSAESPRECQFRVGRLNQPQPR